MNPEGNRLISFSLYGTNPMYSDGAIRCAETAPEFYPGWKTRFYISSKIAPNIIERISATGAEIIVIDHSGTGIGMFWRFYAIAEPNFQYIILRDTDSRFSVRETTAVQAWIDSGKSLHIIRDHPNHRSVMMGGLWGIKGGRFKNIEKRYKQWKLRSKLSLDRKHAHYGSDQIFLTEVIYPEFKNDVCIHSEHVRYPGESPTPIPAVRENHEFLGQRYPEDPDLLQKQINLLIKNQDQLISYPFPESKSIWRNFKDRIKRRPYQYAG